MRFERQHVTTLRDDRLNEVVDAFTPSMQRVCGFFRPEELQAMIERMARNHLASRERTPHLRPPLAGARVPLGTRRSAGRGTSPLQRTPRPES